MNITTEKVNQVFDQVSILQKQYAELCEQTPFYVSFSSRSLTFWINNDMNSINTLAKFLNVNPNSIEHNANICHNGVAWVIYITNEDKARNFNPSRDLQYLDKYEELFIFSRKIVTLIDCLVSIMVSSTDSHIFFNTYSLKEKEKIISYMPVKDFKANSNDVLSIFKDAQYIHKGNLIRISIKEYF